MAKSEVVGGGGDGVPVDEHGRVRRRDVAEAVPGPQRPARSLDVSAPFAWSRDPRDSAMPVPARGSPVAQTTPPGKDSLADSGPKGASAVRPDTARNSPHVIVIGCSG
ncbi:hypothetical protein GCM10029978_100080 [Actinoallomurus acanthiterrae]